MYAHTVGSVRYHFADLRALLARATPARSGDSLAAVARRFEPLLVNTVVGFIGPEYLYDGKQILRAGLEEHFCGKLMGLPMGCDVCYTNHAEADQEDMDALLTMLGVAGRTYIMGVPARPGSRPWGSWTIEAVCCRPGAASSTWPTGWPPGSRPVRQQRSHTARQTCVRSSPSSRCSAWRVSLSAS